MPPKYRAIMCDPPWGFSNKATRAAASNHYSMLTPEEIFSFPVSKLASDNSVIFLWCPNSFTKNGILTMENWGFRFILPLTWVKMKNGRLQMGLGNYFRNCGEILLFGMKGIVKPDSRSLLTAFIAPREEHSKKPDIAYKIVEEYTSGPRLDMFARDKRIGWDVWGDEVEGDIELVDGEWHYVSKT